MAHCRFTDFDITIHGLSAPYMVHAAYRQHTAAGQFSTDAAQPEWSARLDTLARVRGLAGRDFLQATGMHLYRQLFYADVRDLWVRACADLDDGAGICIRIMAQPPAVAALPWECMFDPDRNAALAGSSQTPVVRVENLLRHVGHVRALAAKPPLRLLMAIPEDPTGQIEGEAEQQRLLAALGPLAVRVIAVTPLSGRFNVVELRQAIARSRPDIVHLVTHGRPDGVLLWQNEAPVLVPAAALRVALDGADSVKLVVLNACSTAQGALAQSLASVGAQLLQTGAPAVIAMQFDIEENAAADFARYFYQDLLEGRCAGNVHQAVSIARSNLYALNPDSAGYFTPVLWLNAADGRIFGREHFDMPPVSTHRTAPAQQHELKPLKRQRQQFEEWHAQVVALNSATLPVTLRAVQRPLHDALKDIADLLVQLHSLEHEPESEHIYKQYEEKLALIVARQNTVNRLATVIREQQERRADE